MRRNYGILCLKRSLAPQEAQDFGAVLVLAAGRSEHRNTRMSNEHEIEFVLRDKVEGVEITPSTIGLSRFNEFNLQVETFIAGVERLKADEVRVAVGEGSYKLTAILPALLLAALEPDLQALQREDSLGEIDVKRAEVVGKWQARSKARPELSYAIRPSGEGLRAVELSTATDYRVGDVVPWVKVEKYLFGTVMDMGGAKTANVHLRVEDTGQIVRIGSNQGYLKGSALLYHKALLRVEAEQHFRTGQLRNLRLLSFEDYAPGYDEAAMNRFAEAGRTTWADVPDAAGWVREIRGGG